MAMFGSSPCVYGQSQYNKYRANCCPNCDLVRDTWGHGNVHLGEVNLQSAAYIAGYVTKKMTSKDDERLQGRHPEFSRQSNRPGIGALALPEIASVLLTHDLDQTETDVPSRLDHGRKSYPLGRYLKRKLREQIGWQPDTPEVTKRAQEEEMRPLRDYAFDNSLSFAEVVKEFYKGQTARAEAIHNIYKKENKL